MKYRIGERVRATDKLTCTCGVCENFRACNGTIVRHSGGSSWDIQTFSGSILTYPEGVFESLEHTNKAIEFFGAKDGL